MAAKPDSNQNKKTSMLTDSNTTRNIISADDTPPIYYNSEPSSQPPRYPNTQPALSPSISTTKSQVTTNSLKPANQHRNSAPASTVAAVLAFPYDDLDAQRRADRKKKTLRERWRDFKERNFGEYDQGRGVAGSAAEWNVQGGRLKGGMATPYRRKERQ
jgi:hypothetical protein